MRIVPRDYQAEAAGSIFRYFYENSKGHPVVAMPTGTGKSVVIADFCEQVLSRWPNQRILALTHVKELIEQNYEKLLTMWPTAPVGIYSAGLKRRDTKSSIIFGGIASVAKRAEEFGHIDLILIDEAHLVSPSESTMYRAFILALMEINPYLRVVGFTATFWRLGQGLITEEGGLFTDVCFDITGFDAFNRLLAEGYLCPLIPKKTSAILDVDGVHMRGGEFIPKELQKAVDKDELTYAALQESLELGYDRNSWLIFAAGVEHANHIAVMLNSMGVSCGVVHGNTNKFPMSEKQREETLRAFKAGQIRAVVNNNILTTGFDHPGIDLIIMLRPTASPGLWVQMLGRGTRPVYAPGYDLRTTDGRLASIYAGGKHNCLVLDFAGNTRRLGPINDPVIPKRKGKKGGDAPVKRCDNCNTYNHASVRFCVYCNAEFKFETKLNLSASTEELIKADIPVVEEFKIDHITYSISKRVGRADIIKVSYYCGLRCFIDLVCLEHEGYPRRKAERWWKERCDIGVPDKVEKGVALTGHLKSPTSIRVWTNKKYPEIMAYCFDGSHFGTEDPQSAELPTVQNNQEKEFNMETYQSLTKEELEAFDDDILF